VSAATGWLLTAHPEGSARPRVDAIQMGHLYASLKDWEEG